jgi:ligand-binding sensor domain-containing protein
VLPGDIERLQPAPDGGLWLVTDQGVARQVNSAWSIYLSGFTGSLVGIDAAGRIWATNEDASAISAWDGTSWTDYATEAGWLPIGLGDEWYRDAGWGQSDGLGRFWLATSQDVRVFDGARWTVFTPEDMGMEEVGPEELWPIFTVAVSQGTGIVWVGECDWAGPGPFGGQGVRWFDGSAWRGTDSPVASGCAAVIEEDRSGRVWLGVDENLWRYEPASGNWTQFAPPEPPIDGTRFGFADTIACDPSGDPWPAMVLCGGASCYGNIALYHVHDGAWTQIGEVAEFEDAPYSLAFAAGASWLFWDGAVYRLRGDVPEPLADLYIRSVAVDAAGRVWLVAQHEGQEWLWIFAETGEG